MKLGDLSKVNALAGERAKLLGHIGELRLGVTIHGSYQDDSIVELVRPVVLTELRARVRQIEADLASFGAVIP